MKRAKKQSSIWWRDDVDHELVVKELYGGGRLVYLDGARIEEPVPEWLRPYLEKALERR